MTTINKISFPDFCDENTTVEVACESKAGEDDVFYVQTVDSKYRQDLGCWITADSNDGGEIDPDGYPDFDIKFIVERAEQFIKSETEMTHIKAGYYLRTINDGSCEILEENPKFVNSDTSSYQKEYCVIGKFGSSVEANNNFDAAVAHYSEYRHPYNVPINDPHHLKPPRKPTDSEWREIL